MSHRFKIGDVVMRLDSLHLSDKLYSPATILEKHTVESKGGTRYYYLVRNATVECIIEDFEVDLFDNIYKEITDESKTYKSVTNQEPM